MWLKKCLWNDGPVRVRPSLLGRSCRSRRRPWPPPTPPSPSEEAVRQRMAAAGRSLPVFYSILGPSCPSPPPDVIWSGQSVLIRLGSTALHLQPPTGARLRLVVAIGHGVFANSCRGPCRIRGSRAADLGYAQDVHGMAKPQLSASGPHQSIHRRVQELFSESRRSIVWRMASWISRSDGIRSGTAIFSAS
jgi:hypothetical protein